MSRQTDANAATQHPGFGLRNVTHIVDAGDPAQVDLPLVLQMGSGKLGTAHHRGLQPQWQERVGSFGEGLGQVERHAH